MAGYWSRSFFFCVFMDLDFVSQKKNLVNIQPSWPHAWSITHIYSWMSMDTIRVVGPAQNTTKLLHDTLNSHFSCLYARKLRTTWIGQMAEIWSTLFLRGFPWNKATFRRVLDLNEVPRYLLEWWQFRIKGNCDHFATVAKSAPLKNKGM